MAEDPRTGSRVGGCRIEELIGRGGMGVVYRAEQLNLGRQVAIKLITPDLAGDESLRQRFEQEARLAASLDHPNIVPVHEAGEDHGVLYITMQYVAGQDLRTLLAQEGALSPERAGRIIGQVAAALDEAHAKGLVHRDIKPANILLVPGDQEHAYLSDFGLTKLVESTNGFTKSGNWVGTTDYVAPEQFNDAHGDARSDIYSLACVFFEALTGQVPYPRATEAARIYAKMEDALPLASEIRPGLNDAFDALFARALGRDPGMRYRSAGDLARAAQAALEGQTLTESDHDVATGRAAGEVSPPPPIAAGARTQLDAPVVPQPPDAPSRNGAISQPWRRRHRVVVRMLQGLAAVIVAGAAAFALLVLRSGESSAAQARSSLQTTRAAVSASVSPTSSLVRLRDVQAMGRGAEVRLKKIDSVLHKAAKVGDRRTRRATVAALRAERAYVAGLAQLGSLNDRNLTQWAGIKVVLETARQRLTQTRPAIQSLRLGRQRALLASSASLAQPVTKLDDILPGAAKRLARWRLHLQSAKQQMRDALSALQSYGGSMRGYLGSYDQLRSDTQDFSDSIDGKTYEEVYAYLGEGAQKRQAIKESVSALSAPAVVSGSQSRIVQLLGESVDAMEQAAAGIAENEFSGTPYRDTAGWQAFVSASDRISSELSSARSSWDSGMSSEESSIKDRSLPQRPDV